MNTLSEYRKISAVLLLFFFALVFGTSWYIHSVQSDVKITTQLKIAQQETKLAALSEITDRDGADAIVEEIIKDCSPENRERFDTQLSKLPQLKGNELVEIEQLFNDCGNFFAERKAVMVARLQREYEVFIDFIEVLTLLDSRADAVEYDVEGWGTLVELETKRSLLSTQLVEIQGEIIRALQQDVAIASDDMQETLVEGQKIKDTLFELSGDIDVVRQAVLDL